MNEDNDDSMWFLIPVSIVLLKKLFQILSTKPLTTTSSSSSSSITSFEMTILNQSLKRFKTCKSSSKIIEKMSTSLSHHHRFSHQVAGHTDEDLLCIDGKLMKPSRKTKDKIKLFYREVAIYELMYDDGNCCVQSAKEFTSLYHGVCMFSDDKTLINNDNNIDDNNNNNNDNNNVVLYLVLDDLTLSYKHPCVIDIKMGTQTYEPNAKIDKIEREKEKYRYQSQLGFRIAGFKVYDILADTEKSVGKDFGRSLLPHKVTEGISFFFYNGIHYRKDVVKDVIQKLEKILLWMKSQTSFHFYCSSLLIVYDGAPSVSLCKSKQNINYDELCHFLDSKTTASENIVNNQESIREKMKNNISKISFEKQSSEDISRVRMIDFAHTIHSTMTDDYPYLSSRKQIGPDYGYIHGLEVLLSKLYEILDYSDSKNS